MHNDLNAPPNVPPVPPQVTSAQGTGQTADKQQKIAAYYDELRRGKRRFDPQTAQALLMKLDMENQQHMRSQNADRKNVSLMMAIIFPWRMFDPAMRPTNGTRMLIILAFFFVLAFVLPVFVLKFVHM